MSTQNHALNLDKKVEQIGVQNRIKDFIKNKRVMPWVIELDPTTACNLACHGCISANLLNQGGFPRERIKNLAKEFYENGVKAVVLIGGGEPMAHPEFGTIVDYFFEHDIHVGVTSNGTLIKKFIKSLALRTKWVRISVDAGTESVFQKYRPHVSGKSQFSSVISQMRELSSIKKCKLGYSFLVLTKNKEDGSFLETNAVDILNAAALAKDIGCDYFEVKPSFDMMHFLNQVDNETAQIVNSQLIKIRNLEDDKFKIISPYTLEESLHHNTVQEKDYSRCLTAELRSVFSPSGAYVCPYHRGNENLKIGDPIKETFLEVWNGEKRKKIMSELNPKIHCRFHCIRHKTNIKLESMLSGKEEFDFQPDYDRFI
jgi:MoaA/NifB/PqqE/SkfB family radical SAM enzyme